MSAPSIPAILPLIKKHWKIIAVFVSVGGFFGLFIVCTTPVDYKASGTYAYDNAKSPLTQVAEKEVGSLTYAQGFSSYILSDQLAELGGNAELMDSLLLRTLPTQRGTMTVGEFFKHHQKRAWWKKAVAFMTGKRYYSRTQRPELTLSYNKITRVLTLSASIQDPVAAPVLTELFAQEVSAAAGRFNRKRLAQDIQFYQMMTQEAADRVRDFKANPEMVNKENLESAEAAYKGLAAATFIAKLESQRTKPVITALSTPSTGGFGSKATLTVILGFMLLAFLAGTSFAIWKK